MRDFVESTDGALPGKFEITKEGIVLDMRSPVRATLDGPRYATRKDFVYGEDVTIAQWTISTEDLPRYKGEDEADGQGLTTGE
ncbi:hypothetical protein ABT063_05555 [Streptomyces sp. NPDC002838]|uniref:hypothetical protein n=1 Tax=Streptomyces sp. NPDC002838 TaxID=3154436 RepID=UPI003329AB8D